MQKIIKATLESSMTDGYKPTLSIIFIPKQSEALVVCDQLGEKGLTEYHFCKIVSHTYPMIVNNPAGLPAV